MRRFPEGEPSSLLSLPGGGNGGENFLLPFLRGGNKGHAWKKKKKTGKKGALWGLGRASWGGAKGRRKSLSLFPWGGKRKGETATKRKHREEGEKRDFAISSSLIGGGGGGDSTLVIWGGKSSSLQKGRKRANQENT